MSEATGRIGGDVPLLGTSEMPLKFGVEAVKASALKSAIRAGVGGHGLSNEYMYERAPLAMPETKRTELTESQAILEPNVATPSMMSDL